MLIANSLLAGWVVSSMYYFSRYPTNEELNKAGITWGKYLSLASLVSIVYLIASILVDRLL